MKSAMGHRLGSSNSLTCTPLPALAPCACDHRMAERRVRLRIWGSGVRISSGAPFRFQKNLRKRAAVHPVTQGLPVHPANPGRARTVRVLENERQRQHPTRRRSVPFNRGRVAKPLRRQIQSRNRHRSARRSGSRTESAYRFRNLAIRESWPAKRIAPYFDRNPVMIQPIPSNSAESAAGGATNTMASIHAVALSLDHASA